MLLWLGKTECFRSSVPCCSVIELESITSVPLVLRSDFVVYLYFAISDNIQLASSWLQNIYFNYIKWLGCIFSPEDGCKIPATKTWRHGVSFAVSRFRLWADPVERMDAVPRQKTSPWLILDSIAGSWSASSSITKKYHWSSWWRNVSDAAASFTKLWLLLEGDSWPMRRWSCRRMLQMLRHCMWSQYIITYIIIYHIQYALVYSPYFILFPDTTGIYCHLRFPDQLFQRTRKEGLYQHVSAEILIEIVEEETREWLKHVKTPFSPWTLCYFDHFGCNSEHLKTNAISDGSYITPIIFVGRSIFSPTAKAPNECRAAAPGVMRCMSRPIDVARWEEGVGVPWEFPKRSMEDS